MRYFKNVKEALFEVERDLVEMGIDVWTKSMQNKDISRDPAYQTKELVGYGFRVNNARMDEALEAASEFHKVPIGVVHKYCVLELAERVSEKPVNPGEAYKVRKEVWEQFLVKKSPEDEGKFDYTYAERMAESLTFLLSTLDTDIATRQAVLSVWRPNDLWNAGGRKRIPCSLTYQFIIRPEGDRLVLHVIYTMRSCDIYTHFGFDVAMAIGLGEILKNKMRRVLPIAGIHLTMNIGSLHAYRKDYELRGVF